MKSLHILTLMSLTFSVMAETKIVKPDLNLGHWEVTIDNSDMVDAALARIPKDQDSAQARAMMEKFMPKSKVIDHCVTEEDFNEIEKSFGSGSISESEDNCSTSVLESSSKKMVVSVQCPERTLKVTTTFISPERYETNIVSNNKEPGQEGEITINSVAQWKAAACPANIASASNIENKVSLDDTLLGSEIEDQTQRQKNRVKSRAQRAEDRAVDKGVDKAIDKIFGKIFK